MGRRTTFIGHRDVYIHDTKLKDRLLNAIREEINNGCLDFVMGAHGNFDSMALSACRNLRTEFKNLEIEVVITSLNQINPEIEVDQFGTTKYIPYSDVKTSMYEIEEEYFKKRIISSNKQMIDTCDTIICYVNPNKNYGGARIALKYAQKKGLKIINLYQDEDNIFFGKTEEEKEKIIQGIKNISK